MEVMSGVWSWILANKALLSYPLGIIAAGLEVKGQTQAAAIVGMLATWLNGAGHVKSDSYYKD
mgnify:CR=1 FL=1